jgi:hypothetical protein
VATVDELEEIIAWVRAHGSAPLPLEGWDQASIWGWDEATGSLYAHLWRNTDDPAKQPTIRIEPDDYTPAITLLPTLSQHIAMAVDCDPWEALTALFEVEDTLEYVSSKEENARAGEGGTVVTMTEAHSLPEWPYRP